MSVVTIANGSLSAVLNGTAITDLAVGDNLIIAAVNPATSHVNSSNGGVNINERSDRNVRDVTIRVQKFSDSDIFLNSIVRAQGIEVVSGTVKEAFEKDGVLGVESWILSGGSILTEPTKTNNDIDGNAIMEYIFRFRQGTRNL